MSKSISANDALSMFEDGTGLKWKVINPSQAKNYSTQYGSYVWTLCLDNSCKQMLYVVPENMQPTFSDYEKIIAYLKKHALPMLPKIKLDLDHFPAAPFSFYTRLFTISGTVKPTADIILQYKNSTAPFSYSRSKLMSLKFSQPTQITDYIKAWNKIKVENISTDKIQLTLSNSITGESFDVDLALQGNSFSTTVTPKPVTTNISNTWNIEGQMSLKIEGAVTPSDASAENVSNKFSKIATEGVLDYVKLNEFELKHSTYIYVALGGIALGIITGGIADAALITGGGLGGVEAIANR